MSIGTIGNSSPRIIKNVLLVDLKHNLLSISQLCDKCYHVVFESSKCLIENALRSFLLEIENSYH